MSLPAEELARELDDELAFNVDEKIDEGAPAPDDILDPATVERYSWAYVLRERDVATIEQLRRTRKAEIDAFCDRRLERPKAGMTWLAHTLEGYARRVIGNRSKPKFEDTEAARLALRAVPDKVDVRDEEAFVAWALANDRSDLLIPVPAAWKVDRKAVAKLAKSKSGTDIGTVTEHELTDADGQTVPGVAIMVAQRDSFSIKAHGAPAADDADDAEAGA